MQTTDTPGPRHVETSILDSLVVITFQNVSIEGEEPITGCWVIDGDIEYVRACEAELKSKSHIANVEVHNAVVKRADD